MNKKSLPRVIFAITLCVVAAAAQESQKGPAPQKSRREIVADFINTVRSARVIELNFVWDRSSPLLGLNPPFSLGLHTSHKQTKGIIPGGIAFAADMMFFSGQHGAPTIDAIGHISDEQKLFGGLDAPSNEGPTGLLALGIETYPKERFTNRAVLLDVARFKKVDALAPGQEITAEDLEATAKAEGVEIRAGDSVLIRTGYGRFFESDRAKFSGFRPGPGEGAARWLAAKKIFLAGDDQMSFEVVPEKGTVFPCHRILIADNGIYIVENLNLEELASVLANERVWEFLLVLNPPRIRGATGAASNAFAIIP
ncbi:MAG TPA: cyclase family protein [Blastocatellia bacterium]|nr:cyclase family protein [Blastocatellia bacterium]